MPEVMPEVMPVVTRGALRVPLFSQRGAAVKQGVGGLFARDAL